MASFTPHIRPLEPADFDGVLRFTDAQIGTGYFTRERLTKGYDASLREGRSASFVLVADRAIQGVRLSYQPGQWPSDLKGDRIEPKLWPCALKDAAYFQSLFLAPAYQRQGWGVRLSQASLEVLRASGALAVIAHCWDQSPGNSSRLYLDRMGFQPVRVIEKYWHHNPYSCVICGSPCVCSATEMVLKL